MNYFEYDANSEYPKDYFYRPSEDYPEYPFRQMGLSNKKNDVYRMIRNVFYQLGLDNRHYGTKEWNPLGGYITPGNTVLIKPNLVFHYNQLDSTDPSKLKCLVTHPSIIRCVIDYVVIALEGRGKIILGDAPVQECIFERLLDAGGYRRIERFYSQIEGFPYNIRFEDFRYSVMKVKGEVQWQEVNKRVSFGSKIINIGDKSLFYQKDPEKLRIMNFDVREMLQGHKGNIQKYCISDACLQSDVIINLPKPKTHRLAGMTGAMKNMIGLNARKEYVPHYTTGAKEEGGDAYPYRDRVRKLQYRLWDVRNRCYGSGKISQAALLTKIADRLEKYKQKSNHEIDSGAWKENDTIWRSVLDIAYIIDYADKEGNISSRKQRKVVTVGDMIICGENNGPLRPDEKKVGGILFADNPVEFDLFLAELMGFDYEKIPTLKNAIEREHIQFEPYKSNELRFCGKKIEKKNTFSFLAEKNWRGYIEKSD